MRAMLFAAVVVVVLVVAAYAAGYLPEFRQRAAAEAQVGVLQTQLADAEARVSAAELLGQVLAITDVAVRGDYGQARLWSSSFFDAVRGEAVTTPDALLRDGLNEVLAHRDAVTTALARSESTAIEMLHDIELQLRRALGYATPTERESAPQ